MSAGLEPFLRLWALQVEGRPASGNSGPNVLFVRRGAGRLVLKGVDAAQDEARMAEVLGHWNGEGAVRLVEAAEGAVLIERAQPGEPLASLVRDGRDDEATLILAEIMERLNRPAPATGGFRTIQDWGLGFRRNFMAADALGVDKSLMYRAETLFFQLCDTQGPAILLHGDLHHDNVVRDDARGWLAIDPKGVLGEAEYETGAMLRNPRPDMDLFARPEIIARRVAILCASLGHDRQRVLGWGFAQAALSHLWGVEGGNFDPRWIDAATAFLPLL